jgi:hypothetical protein
MQRESMFDWFIRIVPSAGTFEENIRDGHWFDSAPSSPKEIERIDLVKKQSIKHGRWSCQQ